MSFSTDDISIVLVISFISIILAYINFSLHKAHLKYFLIRLIVKKKLFEYSRDVYSKKQCINFEIPYISFLT